MLVTDARTKIKPSGSGCLIENVALYFSFLFVLLSNNVTQLQWQPLAFQISTSFFVVWPIAGGGGNPCRNSVLSVPQFLLSGRASQVEDLAFLRSLIFKLQVEGT